MQNRVIPAFVLAVLVVVAIAALARVYTFGQERFFTIDEYQFGHATWLVSQGDKPYVDFFEHHLPLSYVLHAPLFVGEPGGTPFSELALRFRTIVFGYILVACLLGLLATRLVTRDRFEALLTGFLPVAIGFGLMSAIDYRADSIAAFAFVSCLFVLEMNRAVRWRWLAVVAGLLAMTSAFMTQKTAAVGGATIALLYGVDLIRGLPRRAAGSGSSDAPGEGDSAARPFITSPLAFGFSGAALLVVLLALGAAAGVLGAGYETTIRQAADHEFAYRERSVREFLDPFLSATWPTTIPILGFAAFYLVDRRSALWRCALLTALVGSAMVRAQFPYNYVYPSFLIGLCAVRGYAILARRLPLPGAMARARPILYLVPLLVLPDQLGFVSHTTSNAHQLAMLDKIERLTTDVDRVIDNAGGALFRRHPSYYFHHGAFHRVLFQQYFERDLIEDYRRSEAPLWIRDLRFNSLPESTKTYLRGHYVRIDGDLHALGIAIPAYTSPAQSPHRFEIIRAGYYHLFPADERRRADAAGRPSRMRIDGAEVTGGGIELDAGIHFAAPARGSPIQVLSSAPASAFANGAPAKRTPWKFSMLFEFDDAR